MTIRRIIAVIVLLALGTGAALLVSCSVEDRSRAYARVQSHWFRTWPLERGKYLPLRLAGVLNITGFAPPVQVEVEPGMVMVLDPGDVIDREILATGKWSDNVWGLIEQHLEDGSVLIDVGAHIGSMTLRASNRVGLSGVIVAVEPNPVTAIRLRRNIAASGSANVRVRQVACGRMRDSLDLYAGPPENSGATSLSRLFAMQHSSDGETVYRVEVVPLDEIVESLGLERVDVIKIDTEGAEVEVLRGATRTLEQLRPAIVLETVDDHLKTMGDSLEILEDLLAQAGYVQIDGLDRDTEWVWRGD